MKIITKTKNIELTGDLQSFIEKKIGSIEKFINILKRDDSDQGKTLGEVFVEAEKETEHHKKGKIYVVKVQVIFPGKSVVVVYRADDLFKAIIGAKDEMKMEVEKYKAKNIENKRRQRKKTKEGNQLQEAEV